MNAEKNFYGELVSNAERTINFYPIETATYTVIWDDGKAMVKEASEFLYNVRISNNYNWNGRRNIFIRRNNIWNSKS